VSRVLQALRLDNRLLLEQGCMDQTQRRYEVPERRFVSFVADFKPHQMITFFAYGLINGCKFLGSIMLELIGK